MVWARIRANFADMPTKLTRSKYVKNTSKRFQNLKKDKISLKEITFQMDNAIPAATQNFRASWNVSLVKQSPNSSDLNLLYSFLCRQVNSQGIHS